MFSESKLHNFSRQYYYLLKSWGLIHRYIVLYVPKQTGLLPTYYEIRGLVGSQNGSYMHLLVPTIRSGRQIEDFGSYLLRDTLLLTKLIKICVIYINYFDRVIK